MKKNVLNKEAVEQLVARVRSLQPHQKALWGQMNATEMLLHCNLCNAQLFDGEASNQATTGKQYFLRVLALYLAPRFQKNRKGDERNDTRGKTDPSQFEAQKQRFIQIISRFPEHQEPMNLHHVAFGNLSTRQWGIAAWKHMDHHLRQFGV